MKQELIKERITCLKMMILALYEVSDYGCLPPDISDFNELVGSYAQRYPYCKKHLNDLLNIPLYELFEIGDL